MTTSQPHANSAAYAPHGLFIAFEGGEGAGKSTQIRELAARLTGHGHQVTVTREPGATPLGAQIRALLLDPATQIAPRAEALLYAADRAHHVATVVRPALAAGHVVLTDRYIASSVAYQGGGRDLDPTRIADLSAWATHDLTPDLTILLDLDPEIGLARAGRRGTADRLEREHLDFHHAVRESFLAQARADLNRWAVIDAAADPATVTEHVWACVTGHLDSNWPSSPRPDTSHP